MQTNQQLLGAIRGPVMLITLGTLLAIDHNGGIRFVRIWPVLIIVFGILKLAEYLAGNRPLANTGAANFGGQQ
jgi:hypothetical protein